LTSEQKTYPARQQAAIIMVAVAFLLTLGPWIFFYNHYGKGG
jgi:hypothetical protein